MRNELRKTIIWVTIYSIGMAFIESSVVVYLRALCYPEGFVFPMKDIGNHLTGTEFFREIGTLIMLVSIGFLAGRTKIQRFAYFIFSFAVWDIFYYVFLKILLDWPSSLAEWDILFLVPVPWVGPVIAPVICALLMIFLALALLWAEKRNGSARIDGYGWLYLITGSLVVIVSFTMDYVSFLHRFYSWGDIIGFQWMSHATKLSEMYIPLQFNWWVFFTGIAVITTGILRLIYKAYSKKN
ncbi:MAG: hypothetical protein ABIJ16_03395 [Bacteroidota bacterium]